MLEQFSATIDKVYAAASDGSYWGEALAAIEDLTGSAGAVVHLVPKRPGGRLTTLLGTSAKGYFLAEHVAEWTRDYAPMCPRLAAATRWPDAPYFVDHMLLSEREMDLNPVYEWYGSYGLRYFIGSRLYHSADVEVVWSLQRRRDQGHAQAADITKFGRVKPHLARAVSLADQLGMLRSFQRFGSTMLEALPQAVFALDANGVVLFANDKAEQLLSECDGFRMEAGMLRATLAAEQSMFDDAIRSALAPLGASVSGWTRISRLSRWLPYAVFVAPLNAADEELLGTDARVVVMVNDPGEHRAANEQMLVSVYRLTDTEARLASALSAGHSVESAAALLEIQLATARTHLKHVFRKMQVSRQQDLVRLLTSLSNIAPHA